MCGINEDAGVLWRDNALDYGGEIVDIGQCFNAENDIIERRSGGAGGFLWSPDDCVTVGVSTSQALALAQGTGDCIPCLGLKRSLPNLLDL